MASIAIVASIIVLAVLAAWRCVKKGMPCECGGCRTCGGKCACTGRKI